MRARLSTFHTSLWGALGLAAVACGGKSVVDDGETAGREGLGGTGGGRAGTDFGGTGGDLVGTGGNFGGSAGNFGGTAGAFGGTGGSFAGTGGNFGGIGGGPDLQCSNPRHVLGADGNPTGYVQCEGGFIRRPERRECASIVPRPDVIAPALDGGRAGCTRDQDCTAAPYGHCSMSQGLYPPPSPYCNYGCRRDEDCPSTHVCLCGTPVGSCVQANCTTDADCGELLCTSSLNESPCGGTFPDAFRCQTRTDKCRGGADCPPRASCYATTAGRACLGPGACGRPFLVHGELRQAALASHAAGFTGAPVQFTSALDPMLRKTLAAHWSRNGLMEHASIAAFARFSLQLLELGAPAALLRDAALAMGDEIAHAELCFGLASSYAGCRVEPGPLPMHGVLDEVSFVDIVHTAILEACLGETFAAAEAAEAVEYVRDPEVKAVLEQIARDEARHAELGWKFLRWALEHADPATHAILTERLANVVEQELARTRDSAAPNAASELLEHGVLTDALRSEVRRATLAELVVPIARALTELGLRAA